MALVLPPPAPPALAPLAPQPALPPLDPPQALAPLMPQPQLPALDPPQVGLGPLDPPQVLQPLMPQPPAPNLPAPDLPQPELASPLLPQPPALAPPQKLAPLAAAEVRLAQAAPPATDAGRLDSPGETLEKAGEVAKDLATGDVPALRRGPLLIHGNFCGIGGRPGLAPVDALDAACERHDACTRTGRLPSCSCNERLRREAAAVADDPASPAELKALAAATAASMAVLLCK